MNRIELVDFLWHCGLGRAHIEVSDADYSFPSEEWISGTFSKSWLTYNFSRGLEGYQPEKNDCEDFARRCASYACDLHAGNTGQQTGLAFGEFYFTRDDGGGHAINCAVVADERAAELHSADHSAAPKLLFFEPQDGKVISLTETERSSCRLLKI